MALLVQKFGGTSVANMDRIRYVASLIAKAREDGNQIVAVVSAMAGVTNQLVSFIQSARPTARDKASLMEHDVILSAGEQVTCGLLSLCLQEMGIPSRSFLGWQVPIQTNDRFTYASVADIHEAAIQEVLSQGGVPVVAGFQGIHEGRVTTLGRGGSDATAVALAHFLKADICDIYTDVSGVFTADPRVIAKAKRLDQLTFAEMLELSNQGAKVLQAKSVELAQKYNVKLRVLSSFEEAPGTEVVPTLKRDMHHVAGLAHHFLDAKIGLRTGSDPAKSAARLKEVLAAQGLFIDGITQNIHDESRSELIFGIKKADLLPTLAILQRFQGDIAFSEMHVDQKTASLSIVGEAIGKTPDFCAKVLASLRKAGIFGEVLVISPMKLSFMIQEEKATEALSLLHEQFVLAG